MSDDDGPDNPYARRDYAVWSWNDGFTIQEPWIPSAFTKMDISLSNQAPKQPFRFLDLPPELRLHIYKMLLVHRRRLVRLFDRFCSRLRTPTPANLAINVLLVNHQVHNEAVKVLYGENTFCIAPTSEKRKWRRRAFMAHVEPVTAPSDRLLIHTGTGNRSLIRKVEIQLGNPVEHSITEYTSMASILPNLKSIVYFFDWYTYYLTEYDAWFAEKLGEYKLDNWYQRFFAKMPKADKMTIDMPFVKHPGEEHCKCAKGLLRGAIDAQFPNPDELPTSVSQYWRLERQEMDNYYDRLSDKEMRLTALGHNDDFREIPYGYWRFAQLDQGDWDRESLPTNDADSVEALEEEFPTLFDAPDRYPHEDRREFLERKVFEFLDSDIDNSDEDEDENMSDDESDPLSTVKIQDAPDTNTHESDELPLLKYNNPFADRDQYALKLWRNVFDDAWRWDLIDPIEDDSIATSDDDYEAYGSSDDETEAMQKARRVREENAQRRADDKLADLTYYNPHHDGKQTTLKIMNSSGSTSTKWSLQHPSFDDEEQLKLMVVRDDKTGNPMWKMMIQPAHN